MSTMSVIIAGDRRQKSAAAPVASENTQAASDCNPKAMSDAEGGQA